MHAESFSRIHSWKHKNSASPLVVREVARASDPYKILSLLKTKREVHRRWKCGQIPIGNSKGIFRACRDGVRKAKAELKLKALTTSLEILFQNLTNLLVKKCFPMSSLNLLWCSFEPFPCVPSLDSREKRSAPPHNLLRKLQSAMRSPSAFFSPN